MIEFKLEKQLPYLKEIFDILKILGYQNSILFGGSIRDFVLSNYQTDTINDYDIRIVSNVKDFEVANSIFWSICHYSKFRK